MTRMGRLDVSLGASFALLLAEISEDQRLVRISLVEIYVLLILLTSNDNHTTVSSGTSFRLQPTSFSPLFLTSLCTACILLRVSISGFGDNTNKKHLGARSLHPLSGTDCQKNFTKQKTLLLFGVAEITFVFSFVTPLSPSYHGSPSFPTSSSPALIIISPSHPLAVFHFC